LGQISAKNFSFLIKKKKKKKKKGKRKKEKGYDKCLSLLGLISAKECTFLDQKSPTKATNKRAKNVQSDPKKIDPTLKNRSKRLYF